MKKFLLTTFLLMIPVVGLGQTKPVQSVSADVDSTRITPPIAFNWGEIPARSDTTMAHFDQTPRAGWETAAMVPYHILGIPFRILDFVGTQTIKGMDRLGIFGMPPAEHAGIPLPFGTFLMPEGAISGLQGFSYGLNVRRPNFLGPGNMAFVTDMTEQKKALSLAGDVQRGLLPDKYAYKLASLEPYGMYIVIGIVLLGLYRIIVMPFVSIFMKVFSIVAGVNF